MQRIRRTVLYFVVGLCLIVLTGCVSAGSRSIKSGKDLSIVVTTDIHYLANELTDGGKAFQSILAAGDGKQINYIDEITDAFASDMAKQKPDILIISGDLTLNGEKKSHLAMAEKLAAIESKSGTRVFVIPGNHDIQNPWAIEFRGADQYSTATVTPEEFSSIYQPFGYGDAISKDPTTLSYLAAPSDDLWLLMLDTNLYERNIGLWPTTNGEITAETFEWIRQCSERAKANNAQILTVMHHNLFNHSDILNDGFTIDHSSEVYQVFQECDLNLVLSGHIHIQDIQSKGEGEHVIYDIVTSALSVYPVQYGVLNYSSAQGFDYQTARVDVEGWARERGSTDQNLLQYNEYARQYFADVSFNKAYEQLSSIGTYNAQDVDLMAKTMSELNIHYFGGTTHSVRDEISQSTGYQLWHAADSIRLRDYVLSMLQSGLTNPNRLQIPN